MACVIYSTKAIKQRYASLITEKKAYSEDVFIGFNIINKENNWGKRKELEGKQSRKKGNVSNGICENARADDG